MKIKMLVIVSTVLLSSSAFAVRSSSTYPYTCPAIGALPTSMKAGQSVTVRNVVWTISADPGNKGYSVNKITKFFGSMANDQPQPTQTSPIQVSCFYNAVDASGKSVGVHVTSENKYLLNPADYGGGVQCGDMVSPISGGISSCTFGPVIK